MIFGLKESDFSPEDYEYAEQRLAEIMAKIFRLKVPEYEKRGSVVQSECVVA